MAKRKSKGSQGASNGSATAAKSARKSSAKVQDVTGPGKIAQLREFYEQSLVEMKKVTWPSRKETIATSLAVLALVFVMSLFLGVVDLGLAKAIEAILS